MTDAIHFGPLWALSMLVPYAGAFTFLATRSSSAASSRGLRPERTMVTSGWNRRQRPRWFWLASGTAVLAVVLTACGGEGQAQLEEAINNVDTSQVDEGTAQEPAEAPPAETAPPETAPPQTAPPQTAQPQTAPPQTAAPAPQETVTPTQPPQAAPPVQEATDDGRSTEDWILVLAIAIAALVIFIVAATAASRRADARAAATAELNSRLSEIVGAARWIHDSGSTEVLLATNPEQMQTAWREVRSRMVNLESHIAALAAGSGDTGLDQDLRYLGQCVADLRSAEEGYVSTRIRSPADHVELTRTSDQAVADRRQQLAAAIEPVATAMRR